MNVQICGGVLYVDEATCETLVGVTPLDLPPDDASSVCKTRKVYEEHKIQFNTENLIQLIRGLRVKKI